MARPRKHDTGLPKYVRPRYGSYYYKDKFLCRIEDGEAKMYEELAKRKAEVDNTLVPFAVALFKADYLPTLSPSAKVEHGRLLNVFASEFAEFKVGDVESPDIKDSIKNLYAGRPSAAKHYKARISTFFRWCISDKKWGLKVNPCHEVWLESHRARKTPWNDKLFWQVRNVLSPMMQCYHDLSFLLYQRTTDVRRLLRTQDQGDGIFFEPTKTAKSSGQSVIVPVTPAIRAVLKRAAKLSKGMKVVCPYIIHTTGGAAYTRSGIHSAYRRADILLHGEDGMLNLNPKALLPFASTSAKKQGATLEQIKVGRAHTNISTTEGYIQHHETPVSEVRLVLPPKK